MNFCELNDLCNNCCCQSKPTLLGELKEDTKKLLYENKQEIKYSKGETVVKQDTRVNHIVCLKSGFLKVYNEAENGKRLVRKILVPGEIIGGMGFFVDDKHHFTCTAITDVECCLISAEKFKECLNKDHDMCLNLIKRVNKFAVNGLKRMVSLSQKSMHERVSEMLLYLSDKIYKSDKFETELNRQDMADICSLSKESVIRILKNFKEEEIIIANSNKIEILNKPKLLYLSKSL